MSREEKINKMIEEIKIRRNDEQYRGGPFPIYHIEFDILLEEIERLNELVKGLREERDYLFNKTTTESKFEIERLNKENNDLRRLYQRTYKHLFEIGNDELARYFQAQIDECNTFYIEPIIDYYEENKKLNNIINELEKYLNEQIQKSWEIEEQCYENIESKLQELKGSE